MTWISQLRSGALAALLALGSLTCGGDGVTPPPPGATAIEMASGNGQSGVTGQPLASPLVILVTDDKGDPVKDVTVGWEAQGGGSVSSATSKTGSDGHAAITRVLGPSAGDQATTATVSGLQGSPVTFVATAVAGGEPGLLITTQPQATAVSAEVFEPSAQPVVVLTDAGGDPVGSAEVTASIASGSGTLEGDLTATTNSSGVASFVDLGIRGSGSYTLKFTAGTVTATSSAITISALPAEASTGKWGPVVPWDIVPLHMSLLPTGKILAWGRFENNGTTMGMPRLWDPSNGSPAGAPMAPADTMLFCSGHAFMADGRLMVSGGHKADDQGLDVTNIFNPVSESWVTGLPKMAKGRWYPTVTTLPDGRLVTVAGRDTVGGGTVVLIPEVWEGGQWVQLPGASLNLPYYPRDFVAPDGRVFYAGERVMSRWLDVDGSTGGNRGKWVTGPSHIWPFNREYGSAVMYEPGKILYVGGGGDPAWSTQDNKSPVPTATGEKIDLNQGSPAWQSAGAMSSPRRHLNATILPDGEVLVTGGVSGGGFNDIASAVKTAEIWNPENNGWTTLASASVARGYHSVSLLLPDGTVLHGASGDANVPGSNGSQAYPRQTNHEIFSPPYLFKGARPTIGSAPATVSYGVPFAVSTPYAAQITSVRWIRLGSVTHAFNMNQRANTLTFTAGAGTIEVTPPSGPNLAPPGHYLLFLLNRNGVPSVGKVVQVQ